MSFLAFTVAAYAQEADRPPSMIGFLEPGTKVSVHMLSNTGDIMLRVFSSEQFQIALDAKELELDALVSKHPSLQKRIQEATDFVAKNYGDNQTKITLDKVKHSFGTIRATGSDYVVIEMDGLSGRSRVFSRDAIKRIYLNDHGVGLLTSINGHVVFFDRD
jgi:hypothetical protein